jgi:hypothetical protein
VKTLYLLPFIWLFLASSMAGAQQNFRCGSASSGTHIVKTGESKADVLMKCGEPMMKEEGGSDTKGRFGTSTTYRGFQSRTRGAYQESTLQVQLWYYNLGEGQFNRILEFHGGTLAFIHVSNQYGKGLPDWERNR